MKAITNDTNLGGGGITPEGTINIVTNGTTDVTTYANADVQVPASAVVSGTKSISTNGTHDVTDYASVSVSIPTHGTVTKKFYSAAAKSSVGYAEAYFTVTVNSAGTISITATSGKVMNISTGSLEAATSYGVYAV